MFKITRNFVRLALLITGVLVLISYAVGAIRLESPMDLWGGVPDSWIPFILVFMGLAVIGFLVFTWFFLIQWDPNAVDTVKWPWQKYEQCIEPNEESELNTVLERGNGGGYARQELLYFGCILFLGKG